MKIMAGGLFNFFFSTTHLAWIAYGLQTYPLNLNASLNRSTTSKFYMPYFIWYSLIKGKASVMLTI